MEQLFSLEHIHGMTPDKLRKFPGLESLTDEQADKVIFSLYQMLSLFFEYQPIENIHSIDNQQVVYLREQKQAA